jgi:hypothetical protein
MPSRKQRRRREKLQRHEWEYVLETEEGEEIPLKSPRPRRGEDGEPARDRQAVDRRGRVIQKPSLQRVLRRTLIFAPLLFLVIYFTGQNRLSLPAMVAQTALLIAFFIPFSYLVDVLVYRALTRRLERR